MTNPVKPYFTIDELIERWKVGRPDLLEYCRSGKLDIVINWGRLRERNHNRKCSLNNNWISLKPYLEDHYPFFRINSPCEICRFAQDNTACHFEHSEVDLAACSEAERESLNRVDIKETELLVSREEVDRFEKAQGRAEELQSIPPYLQPDHKFYCKEMAAMADTWDAIFEKKKILDDKTCKQAALRYMQKNYKDLGKIKSENLASIIHACFQGSPTEWNKFVQESKQK